jgi:hypothetical protein
MQIFGLIIVMDVTLSVTQGGARDHLLTIALFVQTLSITEIFKAGNAFIVVQK